MRNYKYHKHISYLPSIESSKLHTKHVYIHPTRSRSVMQMPHLLKYTDKFHNSLQSPKYTNNPPTFPMFTHLHERNIVSLQLPIYTYFFPNIHLFISNSIIHSQILTSKGKKNGGKIFQNTNHSYLTNTPWLQALSLTFSKHNSIYYHIHQFP